MRKIYVAGHLGMVGSAILKALEIRVKNGEDIELITCSREELDLTNQLAVRDFMTKARPDIVILAAAKVGGIHANNTFPAEFIYENLMIECNVIHEAFMAGVKSLLQLGSSCIYPRAVAQPIREDALLTGALEPSNEPYAVAKIAGIKMCESYNRQYGTDYRCIMPTNLYGPGDNFHPLNSHVMPALIRRFWEATQAKTSEVTIWGTGTPKREFLHVEDMAQASLFVMDLPQSTYRANTKPRQSYINLGSGSDISIIELAKLIASIVGYGGVIKTDPSKPDGISRKLLDSSILNSLGWQPRIELVEGVTKTFKWFLKHQNRYRT